MRMVPRFFYCQGPLLDKTKSEFSAFRCFVSLFCLVVAIAT